MGFERKKPFLGDVGSLVFNGGFASPWMDADASRLAKRRQPA
jgi:hypothetical protein